MKMVLKLKAAHISLKYFYDLGKVRPVMQSSSIYVN